MSVLTTPILSVLAGEYITVRYPNVLSLISLLDHLDEFVNTGSYTPYLRNTRQLPAACKSMKDVSRKLIASFGPSEEPAPSEPQ